MSESSEDHIPVYRVRPRFKVETSESIDELSAKIESCLTKENAPCIGQIKHGYAQIYLPHKEQHYWSPRLSLTMEKTETGTELRGLFGPRPAVWTMFVFFYSLIGFAILIISIVGFSYISLDKSGSILWFVPILAIVFLTLYLVSYFGKKMGHDQMVTLHKFIEKSTDLKI